MDRDPESSVQTPYYFAVQRSTGQLRTVGIEYDKDTRFTFTPPVHNDTTLTECHLSATSRNQLQRFSKYR